MRRKFVCQSSLSTDNEDAEGVADALETVGRMEVEEGCVVLVELVAREADAAARETVIGRFEATAMIEAEEEEEVTDDVEEEEEEGETEGVERGGRVEVGVLLLLLLEGVDMRGNAIL